MRALAINYTVDEMLDQLNTGSHFIALVLYMHASHKKKEGVVLSIPYVCEASRNSKYAYNSHTNT